MTPDRELRYLLQARNVLLWVPSPEERRVEREIAKAAAKCGHQTVFWDCASGARDAATGEHVDLGEFDTNPAVVFDAIRKGYAPMRPKLGDDGKALPNSTTGEPLLEPQHVPCVWVLRDLDRWLGEPVLERGLKTLARDLQEVTQADHLAVVVVLTHSAEVPAGLRGLARVLDWPLPTRDEIGAVLARVKADNHAMVEGGEDGAAIDAAAGLAMEDAHDAFLYSIVSNKRRIVPSVVAGRKKAVIDRERVLTWYPSDPRGLDAIGGLGELKRWLQERRLALSPEAREYGLPAPKGLFLTGPPGNGKSLTAKAVASAWGGIPLLKLDMGALVSKWQGESQQNIRHALKIAEAVAPCVLWADEIEKALAGATGHSGDNGVSADQLGTLLTWLQEHEGAVFVVATSNDPLKLPPELTRKGRFDEIFYVGLPSARDREAVLHSALSKHAWSAGQGYPAIFPSLEPELVAEATDGFSGAEVAELVPSAMFTAFADGRRPLRTADLLDAARRTVPVSRSRAEHIAALEAWAKTRARFAAEPEKTATTATPRPQGGYGRLVGVELEEA